MTREQKWAFKKLAYEEGRTLPEICQILNIPMSEAIYEYGQFNTKKLDFDDFRKEKERRDRLNKFKNIWEENREAVVAIVAVLGGVGTKIIHGAIKRSNLKKEADNKELYCYDRSLGHYWRLKRKLSNREWVEIDERKKRGERLADILKDLNVLA